MNRHYTGIGSRATPQVIQREETKLSIYLSDKLHYILRSGHAEGSDIAFERGVVSYRMKEIFPIGYPVTEESWELVKHVHPNIKAAKKYRSTLGRNPFQLLGKNLDNPSDFLVCWTENGESVGGTAVNIRIARIMQIPTFNLYHCSIWDVINYAKAIVEEEKLQNCRQVC